MKLKEVATILNAEVICGQTRLEREVEAVFASDLMSDVLASIQQSDAVLLTGLCNPQVVRTAAMADMAAIVLVRGKTPPPETIDLAEKEGIPLISTPFGMFEICGKLHRAGLASLEKPVSEDNCGCE